MTTTMFMSESRRRSVSLLLGSLLFALAPLGCASEDDPGGVGDACTRSADCEGTLRCKQNKCMTKEDAAWASLEKFSFFVASQAAMVELSGHKYGFGGDLRFGETGPGAGLRGADKICETIAERSMPGSSVKQWRAFLSVQADENGKTVHAIDRIGEGPWYDRVGRTVSVSKADLVTTWHRIPSADPAIKDDLPNEWGVPNHQPDPNLPPVENHHTLTGSSRFGKLYPPLGDYNPEVVKECAKIKQEDPEKLVDWLVQEGFDKEYAQKEMVYTQYFCAWWGRTWHGYNLGKKRSSTCNDWTTADGAYENGFPRIGMSWPRPEEHKQRFIGHWINVGLSPGCGRGGQAFDVNWDALHPSVGARGGYGGIYCFAKQEVKE